MSFGTKCPGTKCPGTKLRGPPNDPHQLLQECIMSYQSGQVKHLIDMPILIMCLLYGEECREFQMNSLIETLNAQENEDDSVADKNGISKITTCLFSYFDPLLMVVL